MKKISYKKILKISLILITTLILFAMGYIYFMLSKSLPQIKGELKLNILLDEVTVDRDAHGVPTIKAKNDSDLYKAQGFTQAQDRLFQMEMARRQAKGQLSEIVGEVALKNDKKFLSYSLLKAAKESYASYSDEAKKILKDFTDGVNAYIQMAEKEGKLPYEFRLMNIKASPWTEIDSLVIGKYMAYDLGGHWDYQVFNNWVLNNLGEEKLKDFLPSDFYENPDNIELIKQNKLVETKIDNKLANLDLPHIENGSNNWVISAQKTKSGKPLLADDPHLGLNLPSIWYQMHLISPNVNVQGVIFTGIPGIILGNNNHIAWGVTNVGPDVQDLYIEKVNPKNPHQFEYDGKWYNAEVVKHEIKIKGKPSENFEVLYTKNGPIIDELVSPVNNKNLKFSMQWTALDSTNELEAIIKINRAKNWTEFENALKDFKSPAQNFVFADNSGFIGFKANGNIPIRKKGTGALPVPGYTSEYGWKGYIDYDKLPKIVNPDSGYISTANTKTIEDYPHYLANIWAQPYRKNRIDEVLSSKNDFTYEDMQALQMDTKNLHAQEFIPKILSNLSDDTIQTHKKIIELLKKWDFNDDKNKPQTLIFNEIMEKIKTTIYTTDMNKDVYNFFKHKNYLTDRILRNAFEGKTSAFIEQNGGLRKVLNTSFISAISSLEKQYGNNPNNWKWGDFHALQFQHPIGKTSAFLGHFLNSKKIPINGSGVTVQAARQNEKGIVNHGASWRFVYDFSTKTGYHTVAPGQSGHFLSQYYTDQVQNWADGKYIEYNENQEIKNQLKLIP